MKKLIIFSLFLTIFLFVPKTTQAALVTVKEGGGYVVNVLSITRTKELKVSQSESIEVKKLGNQEGNVGSVIALKNQDGSFELNIKDGRESRDLDVTTYEDEVLEIEERPETQKLSISIRDGDFVLKQGNISVETKYNMSIDPKTATLSLETPSGFRFLSILPREAVNSVFRARTLDVADEIKLKEGHDGILTYEIEGKRILNIFDIFEYEVPVSVRVSASTAEIFEIEQPGWLGVIGFIFV